MFLKHKIRQVSLHQGKGKKDLDNGMLLSPTEKFGQQKDNLSTRNFWK